MLLGTFQPYKIKLESKYIDILKNYLGFSPIFCFSCETEEEAIINSLMTTGSYPEIFYVIDTDDFIKIDAVKWHYLLCKHREDEDFKYEEINDCFKITSNSPICYLINLETLKKNIKTKFELLNLFCDIDFINEKLSDGILSIQEKIELSQGLFEKFNFLCDTKSKEEALKILKNDFTIFSMSKNLSNLYEVNYKFNDTKYTFLCLDYQRCLFTANIYDIKYKTNEYFNEILQKYKNCFNDTIYYDDDVKIYPNDKCPCCSGLKYKKCCGRFKIKRTRMN